jgi:hypothetical protein
MYYVGHYPISRKHQRNLLKYNVSRTTLALLTERKPSSSRNVNKSFPINLIFSLSQNLSHIATKKTNNLKC